VSFASSVVPVRPFGQILQFTRGCSGCSSWFDQPERGKNSRIPANCGWLLSLISLINCFFLAADFSRQGSPPNPFPHDRCTIVVRPRKNVRHEMHRVDPGGIVEISRGLSPPWGDAIPPETQSGPSRSRRDRSPVRTRTTVRFCECPQRSVCRFNGDRCCQPLETAEIAHTRLKCLRRCIFFQYAPRDVEQVDEPARLLASREKMKCLQSRGTSLRINFTNCGRLAFLGPHGIRQPPQGGIAQAQSGPVTRSRNRLSRAPTALRQPSCQLYRFCANCQHR